MLGGSHQTTGERNLGDRKSSFLRGLSPEVILREVPGFFGPCYVGGNIFYGGTYEGKWQVFPIANGIFRNQPILEKREHWRHIDFSRNEHSVTWINIQFWGCWVWIPWSWRYWPTPNTAPWAKNWFKFTHATMDICAPNPSVKLAAINKFTIVESLLLVKFHENSHALVG